MKTRKIFECTYEGHHIIIEFHEGKTNPYRIYRKWYNMGWHKKMLQKYANFDSCLYHISDYYRENTNVHID